MTRIPRFLAAAAAAASALALSARSTPSDTAGANAAGGSQPVSVRFAAQVHGQPFACGQSYGGVCATRSTITPSDYRLYVSEVALVDETGRSVPVALTQDGIWQLDNIALLDFENGTGPRCNGTAGTNTERCRQRADRPLRWPALQAGRAFRAQPRRPHVGGVPAEPDGDILDLAKRLSLHQVRHGEQRTSRPWRRRRGWPGRRGRLGLFGAPGQHDVRIALAH